MPSLHELWIRMTPPARFRKEQGPSYTRALIVPLVKALMEPFKEPKYSPPNPIQINEAPRVSVAVCDCRLSERLRFGYLEVCGRFNERSGGPLVLKGVGLRVTWRIMGLSN